MTIASAIRNPRHWRRVLRFQVAGSPAPGGSKKAFVISSGPQKGRAVIVDASKKTKPWQATVSNAAYMAYDGPILAGPVMLAATFLIARPKGHYGTGRNAGILKPSAPLFVLKKPDGTKLIRALEDSLTGVIWRDDCLVVVGQAKKRWAEQTEAAGAIVTVSAWMGPLTVGELAALGNESRGAT